MAFPPRAHGVWLVALAAFFAVGLGAVFSHLLKNATVADLLTYPVGTLTVGGTFLLVVLPAGFPATLAGVWLATRLLRRRPAQSLAIWGLRGLAFGALLGASGPTAWFVLLNLDSAESFTSLVPAMVIAGGSCGMLVGLPVGIWCWRVSRP